MIKKCPITNFPIKSKEDWTVISDDKKYKIEISIIGDKIIHIKAYGFTNIERSNKTFPLVEKLIFQEFNNKPCIIIYDYEFFEGACANVKKKYAQWLENNKNKVQAIYFYNLKKVNSILFKTAKLFLKQYKNFYILDSYRDVMEHLQSKFIVNNKFKEINKLNIPIEKEWLFELEGESYRTEISLIGERFYHVKNIGYAGTRVITEVWPIMKDLFNNEMKQKKPYFIHDYSEYKGAAGEVRKAYIEWLIQNSKDISGLYIYGANTYSKLLLNTGKVFLPSHFPLKILNTIDEVFEDITEKENISILFDEDKQLIENIWQEGFVYKTASQKYKVVKKWRHHYRESYIDTILINKNIFIRQFTGKDLFYDYHKVSIDFNNILKETQIDKYHFYFHFNKNVKLNLKFRKYGVHWFNANHHRILSGGAFNLSLIDSISAQLGLLFFKNKKLKKRILVFKDISQIFPQIENYNSSKPELVEDSETLQKLSKKELIKKIHSLKEENTNILSTQKQEINTLFEKLGTISWDENYDFSDEQLDTRKSPFSDLHNLVLLIQKDIQEILSKRDSLIKKAKESDRLKSTFLANMSHEIRTPLNGILGFAGLLAEEDFDSETIKKYSNIIVSNGKNLLNLINDIIDISKIETGQLNIKKENFSVNKLINNTVSLFEQSITFNEKEIFFFVENNLPTDFYIKSDEMRIQQILNNLLNNAIKFTQKGHVKLIVKLINDKLSFSVEDTGIGIEPNKQAIIFDRFRQANENIDRTYGGSGLGLSISKSLAQMLDGDILLQSQKGKGSTFTFLLKIEQKEKIKLQQTNASKITFNQETILIVEDVKDNQIYLDAILKNANLNLLWAATGREAIDVFEKNKTEIKLILLDIQLPDFSGEIVAEKIRNTNKTIPIIAQTANALNDEKEKYLQSNFTDFIGKPINKQKLFSCITKYLTQIV